MLVSADILGLPGCSAGQLKTMITTWKNRLASVGWQIHLGDFCGEVYVSKFLRWSALRWKINGKVVRRVPRSSGFKALGTTFAFDGRHSAELQFRRVLAWGVLGQKSKSSKDLKPTFTDEWARWKTLGS